MENTDVTENKKEDETTITTTTSKSADVGEDSDNIVDTSLNSSKDSSTSSSDDELTRAFKSVSLQDKNKEKETEIKPATTSTSQAIEKPRLLLKTVLERERIRKLADYILGDECKNIIFMTGAGISTSAGIPDFRSPKTGLFSQLQKYDLPYPEAIFDITFFKHNPKPFFHLARELFPGNFKPTPGHYFMKMLHDKGKVLRVYTQNIDSLERLAGLPDEKLVEAHGSFHTGRCINQRCRKGVSFEWMKQRIYESTKEDNVLHCEACNELVKPDITFYGEDLPRRFALMSGRDLPRCDLLIIMGTSLTVFPFAGLVLLVNKHCRRLLINKEPVEGFTAEQLEKNARDHFIRGDSDHICATLAEMCGWLDDFNRLISPIHYSKG